MISLIKSLWRKGLRSMDIVLHAGAHRCATTTFQAYLDQNEDQLLAHGVAVWTPQTTRMGLFDGLVCPPGVYKTDRISHVRDVADALNVRQLLVSEENMIGTPRDNLRRGSLYPNVIQRLARFEQAFSGKVRRIGLAIRSYDSYWTSAMSFAAMRGEPLADRCQSAAIAVQPRTWTDVAKDIRAVFPNAQLHIWLFESFANRPRRQLNMLLERHDIMHLLDQSTARKNNSLATAQLRRRLRAHGRIADAALLPNANQPWRPFTALERQHLAAQYAQDMLYFRSGSDPKISFTENVAIKVPRLKARQAHPAFDIGEHYGSQAKMV